MRARIEDKKFTYYSFFSVKKVTYYSISDNNIMLTVKSKVQLGPDAWNRASALKPCGHGSRY